MEKITKKFDSTQLISIIERVEKLLEDAEAVACDIKEVYSEAKSAGFDPKYIKEMIKLRAKDPDQLDEEDALMEMYRNAVGV